MTIMKILGLGRLPPEADTLIPPADRIVTAEYLSCSCTFRNFRAPGRYYSWKRQWFAGSVCVSATHITAFRWRRRLINTDFEDPRFAQVSLSVDDETLIIKHDAALYRNDWPGSLEYRFRTPDAERIAEIASSGIPDAVADPF